MWRRARTFPLVVLVALAVAFAARRGSSPSAHKTADARTTSALLGSPVDAGALVSLSESDAGGAGPTRTLHGDARRTNRARGVGPLPLKLAWARDVGGAVEAQIVTSSDEKTLYVATLGGKLRALERDGSVRWSADLGDRVYGAPLVADDGSVLVGSDAKRFHAFNAMGAELWKLDVDGEADTSAVPLPGRRVAFAAGRTLYSVGLDGTVAWRFRAGGKVFSSPALTPAGVIVFGAQDGAAYGVDLDGKKVFRAELGADVDSSPAVADDGAIALGTDAGDVVRLSPRGEIVCKVHVGGFVRGALAVTRAGDVLAGTYGPAPRVVRVSPACAVVGSMPIQGTGAPEFGVHGAPLEDDSRALFFGAQDDAVYSVSSGGDVRRYDTGGDVDAPATLLSDGSLVVGSDDGKVYCFTR